MLFSVPLGTSLPGFPATVTLPRLTGCLYCRWLPSCTNNRHPSFSSMVITSLNFMTRNCARTATGLTANCLRHDMRHSEIDLSAYGVTAKRFRTKWVFHPYRGNGDLKGIYPVTSRGRARFSGTHHSLRDARKIENPFRLFSKKGTLLRIPSSFSPGTGLFCEFLRAFLQERDSFANSFELFSRNGTLL